MLLLKPGSSRCQSLTSSSHSSCEVDAAVSVLISPSFAASGAMRKLMGAVTRTVSWDNALQLARASKLSNTTRARGRQRGDAQTIRACVKAGLSCNTGLRQAFRMRRHPGSKAWTCTCFQNSLICVPSFIVRRYRPWRLTRASARDLFEQVNQRLQRPTSNVGTAKLAKSCLAHSAFSMLISSCIHIHHWYHVGSLASHLFRLTACAARSYSRPPRPMNASYITGYLLQSMNQLHKQYVHFATSEAGPQCRSLPDTSINHHHHCGSPELQVTASLTIEKITCPAGGPPAGLFEESAALPPGSPHCSWAVGPCCSAASSWHHTSGGEPAGACSKAEQEQRNA